MIKKVFVMVGLLCLSHVAFAQSSAPQTPLTCAKEGCPDCSCVARLLNKKAMVVGPQIAKILEENGVPPAGVIVLSTTCYENLLKKAESPPSQSGESKIMVAKPDDPKCGCPNGCNGNCNGGHCNPIDVGLGLKVGGCY